MSYHDQYASNQHQGHFVSNDAYAPQGHRSDYPDHTFPPQNQPSKQTESYYNDSDPYYDGGRQDPDYYYGHQPAQGYDDGYYPQAGGHAIGYEYPPQPIASRSGTSLGDEKGRSSMTLNEEYSGAPRSGIVPSKQTRGSIAAQVR